MSQYVVFLPEGCSAVAVHPELLVYAAHCGRPQQHAYFGRSKAEQIRLSGCVEHPDWSLSNGYDMAYCSSMRSSQAFSGVRMASTDEIESLPREQPVTVVGFGLHANSVRSVSARLTHVGTTLHLQAEGVCPGDSGGAVISRLGGEDKLIGIVSARLRSAEPCSMGVTYAVRADRLVDWLNSEGVLMSEGGLASFSSESCLPAVVLICVLWALHAFDRERSRKPGKAYR